MLGFLPGGKMRHGWIASTSERWSRAAPATGLGRTALSFRQGSSNNPMVVIVTQRRRVGCTTAGVPCIGQFTVALSVASAAALGSNTRGLAALK